MNEIRVVSYVLNHKELEHPITGSFTFTTGELGYDDICTILNSMVHDICECFLAGRFFSDMEEIDIQNSCEYDFRIL